MHVALSIVLALAIAFGLVFGSRDWFGRVQKRRHAERIGIEALGARHWRDALGLLVEALAREGYSAESDLAAVQGAPLGERILRRAGQTVLLVYKHGTAYRIAGPALLAAEKRRQESDIDEVILATLGSVDAEARAQAARMRITCYDGGAVWSLLGDRLDAETRAGVDAEAERLIEGPRRMSTLGATVLGLAIVYWAGGVNDLLADWQASSVAETATTPAMPAAAKPVTAAAPPDLEAPADAPQTPPDNPSEALQARSELAKAVLALPGIQRASWSSDSTLVVSLRGRATIDASHQRICELLPKHPGLSEVRLQLEAGNGADVRWRRCG